MDERPEGLGATEGDVRRERERREKKEDDEEAYKWEAEAIAASPQLALTPQGCHAPPSPSPPAPPRLLTFPLSELEPSFFISCAARTNLRTKKTSKFSTSFVAVVWSFLCGRGMGWVDLDLNLPPPPPDPDGSSPLPSPTPLREQDRGHQEFGGVGTSGEERERERDGVERIERIERERDDVAVTGAVSDGFDGGERGGVSFESLRVFDVGAVAGSVKEHVKDAKGVKDVESFVLLREQDATEGVKDERKGESDDDEDDVGSRVTRGRIEVRDGATSGVAAAQGTGRELEDGIEQQVEEQKPVRKRLRTLGQLRTQRNERITPVGSSSWDRRDCEKSSTSSSPVRLTPQPRSLNPVGEVSGGDGVNSNPKHKEKFSENERLERSSVLEVSESSRSLIIENFDPQGEKMQVDGEEGSSESKKKVVGGAKDVVSSDKRRRSIVVLEGEAPPKRARLPRNPLKKTRAFGGVIVGEKLDEGSKHFGKVSKLESPQSSETGKIFINKLENGKEVGGSLVVGGGGRKQSKTQVLKEGVSAVNDSKDVEMPQQVDNGSEVAEGSGVSEEKQEEKPRDVSVGVTVPRRPRKMKEIAVPPTRAPRSVKPPPAVKATEFIRPTVKKPSVTAPQCRPSSAGGNGSRSDLRSGFQDTTIERLQREATCSKLWQSPGNADLQQVPGSFPSVEDYAKVLEPLLFEECRAQLHNNWEELLEVTSGDPHAAVTIKMLERKERGWYDVVLMPMDRNRELRFKEGDVGVLSTPKPGTGIKRKGRLKDSKVESAEGGQVAGRVAGIVRRYVPIDVRDPPGAILRFHISQEDLNKQSNGEAECITNPYHTLQQIQEGGASWYLTVIGGFTTIQREYSALHQLPNFRPQMMNAILQPRPELFPGHPDSTPPPMPDCFTPPFIHHLHNGFNVPQLAAIQWAAAHTAAGTTEVSSNSSSGGQPWPFTLVQGPPGTGKTHTVWGMLNVIHLVQYQRYYAALLKKLAPGSVSSDEYSLSSGGEYYGDGGGTIDEVLQKMDNNLARVLPKLCPKPRMLVCAPSNAATDELLSRVLDRGFIDGEMKQYRPDVARVGVDSASRAAQAVSVERRTEQLLAMDQTQVVRWLQSLRTKEYSLNQTVISLQKDLIDAANTARSQGNVGVDPEILASRDQMRDGKLQQLAAVVEERDKVLVEMSRLFIIEVKFRPGSNFRIEDARRKLEASFANEAEIVFTTVSSSGRKIFSQLQHGFDMVVIDEAAQASEVAVLPPLSLRAARCVLVGDPQQLPATVISRAADTMKYSRSLFERFQQAGCPAILLSVQYRMHPQIRDFPSRYFYQGKLVDSESVKGLKEEVYYKDPIMKPYLFFDISLGKESHAGSVSYQNKMEAQVAVNLYQHLLKTLADEAGSGPPANVSVGMITPYKQQMQCLEKEFMGTVGSNAASKGVYINTVDAFQGQERDVIMMSCVRASGHGVGFVADIRRMNVALTRARRSLWVIGNASALTQSEDWAALLADAKDRGCFISSTTCIQRGLLPEPILGSLGAPLGSPSFRPGGPLSRGRGMGGPHGGRHSSSGRHHYNNHAGEGSHRRGRSNGAVQERGPDGRELWQRPPFDRSCRGQRDGPRPPGFGPQFQHPNRRSKGL